MHIENPYQQYMYSYPHKTAYDSLNDVSLVEYLDALSGKENSLYFHFPFCQYKCGYCNLFSVAGQSEKKMEAYVDAMQRQAEQIARHLSEKTVFQDLTLGGGTPLLLPLFLLRRVFSIAKDYFGFSPEGHSIIVETSPNQTTEEKLLFLKEEGVTRVSIGVQSFQEEELARLLRLHTAASARLALQRIRKVQFDCLNVDLIYGLEGQTLDSLLDSVKQALEYEPEELFVYPLYVKPGTALYKQGAKTAKDAYAQYHRIREFLQEAGYHPYSMRRFVKQKKRSEQLPESFCGFGNTISLGCGARSYLGNLHFCTKFTVGQENCLAVLEEYMETKDYLKIAHGYILSPDEQKRRYVIKHILFGKGICQKDYQQHFGSLVQKDFPFIRQWEREGYLTLGKEYITLTQEGFALSDYLGPQFISPQVKKKSEEFYRKGGNKE